MFLSPYKLNGWDISESLLIKSYTQNLNRNQSSIPVIPNPFDNRDPFLKKISIQDPFIK